MAVTPGTRLGPYEVIAPIGEGGMGQVYRARDTKLNRDVALKVLPDSFAGDSDRLARFQREAQVLASLNHPNIAHIHGLEDSNGVRALVMEFVEGEDLARRLTHGAIPLDEALAIAKQIAEALEAAHEQGIIHRDLKPANIKVTPNGRVKVLDFGLAKALDPPASSPTMSQSPTITTPGWTQAGMILGTAAYMSPEQASGKSADKRSDLWAFGVVLGEMLTGRPVFAGETVAHLLASVLKSSPDLTALPATTPAPIRRLLRRCLEKDSKRRLDSAVAARLEIEDAIASPHLEATAISTTSSRRISTIAAGAGLAGAALAAFLTWVAVRPPPQAAPLPLRFAIAPPPGLAPWIGPFDRSIALSPDGRHLVYTTSPAGGTGGSLAIRTIDELELKALSGVNRARAPFFSPDGQWIGFFQDAELKKVAIGGGPSISLCAFTGAPRGATWSEDGTIVFATSDPTTGLWRVPAGGGEPTVLSTPMQGEGDHLFPAALPAGHGVLFTIAAPGQSEKSDVAVLDARTNQRRTLIRGGSQAEYVETGQLVYAAAGSLRAVHFDLAALQVLSDPVPVLDHVRMVPTGAASYAVSRTGALAYLPSGADPQPLRSLIWVDRAGHEEAINAPARSYFIPRLSPDGGRVALDIRDQENDIWILDLARQAPLRRLTTGASADSNPVWSSDGRSVIFTSNRSGPPRLYRQAADGSGIAEPLPTDGHPQYATSFVSKNSGVVGHRDGPASFDVVLFRFPNRDGDAPVQELVRTASIEHNADLSPNGRYLAYQSNESGQFEVIVRPFPDVNQGMWVVSPGGTRPLWAPSGTELFYRDEAGAINAVPVDTSGPTFHWESSVKLFDTRDATAVPDRNYDVAPDGRRFLMIKEVGDTKPSDIIFVQDWVEELKHLLPKK